MSCDLVSVDVPVKARRWRIARVWPDEYTEDPRIENVLVAQLRKVQDIPAVLKLMNDHFPLLNLRHLKRVRRVPADGKTAEESVEIIVKMASLHQPVGGIVPAKECFSSPSHIPLLQYSEDTLLVRPVCVSKPLTKYQLEVSRRLWATVSSNPLICLDTYRMAPKDELAVFSYLDFLLGSSDSRDGSPRSCTENVAVIRDPVSSKVHYDGSQCRKEVASLYEKMVNHAVIAAISYVSQLQHKRFDGRNQKRKTDGNAEENGEGGSFAMPYLCTGYDALLLVEPCVMCAMALVHARIGRIIYLLDSLENGGVKSVYKLQGIKKINHNFEVWRAELQQES